MLNILLIEDSEDDAFLLEKALQREGITCSLRKAGNGTQAIAYFEGEGNIANRREAPFPDVIFTDLKMPGMDGFAVLQWLKSHPECSLLPVMVLSNSQDERDVEKAYRLGANAYMVKPASLPEFQAVVRVAHDFWMHCVVAGETQQRARATESARRSSRRATPS